MFLTSNNRLRWHQYIWESTNVPWISCWTSSTDLRRQMTWRARRSHRHRLHLYISTSSRYVLLIVRREERGERREERGERREERGERREERGERREERGERREERGERREERGERRGEEDVD